jgi:hypothetical protein
MNIEAPKPDQLAIDINEALNQSMMGYAKICVLDDEDMGEGPKMLERQWNPRPIKTATLAHLRKSLNEGKNLLNMLPENAIYIAVNKDFVDQTSLKQALPQVEFGFVHWTAAAKLGDSTAILANGCHRSHVLREFYKPQLSALDKLYAQETKVHQAMGPLDGIRANIMKLKTKCREEGYWLACFFDLGESTY